MECAAVLEAADKHQPANFVHDPYKGGEGEGRIIKTLRCGAVVALGGVAWDVAWDVVAIECSRQCGCKAGAGCKV